jgi:membrane protein YqaA with SNARE-associated domain
MSDPAASVAARESALRRLYAWMVRESAGPHAWWALAAVAFAEASFFPIPPDVMLAPMALANRRRAFALAGWTVLFSVIGGLFGYAIGSLLYNSVGRWLIEFYGYGARLEAFKSAYAHFGWLILFQGFTPIPFKLVTISAGFAHFNLALFVVLATITRSARFFLEATLLYIVGEPVRGFIEKRLEIVSVVFLLLIIAGFVLARYAL